MRALRRRGEVRLVYLRFTLIVSFWPWRDNGFLTDGGKSENWVVSVMLLDGSSKRRLGIGSRLLIDGGHSNQVRDIVTCRLNLPSLPGWPSDLNNPNPLLTHWGWGCCSRKEFRGRFSQTAVQGAAVTHVQRNETQPRISKPGFSWFAHSPAIAVPPSADGRHTPGPSNETEI